MNRTLRLFTTHFELNINIIDLNFLKTEPKLQLIFLTELNIKTLIDSDPNVANKFPEFAYYEPFVVHGYVLIIVYAFSYLLSLATLY